MIQPAPRTSRRPLTASLALAAALACLSTTTAAAQTVEAAADTYIQFHATSGASNTNYGSATSLATANDGGSFGMPKDGDRFFFIRFDLSLFTAPFSAGQVSLDLQKISGDPADFVVYAIADLGDDENFNESTYTFNNSAYAATATDPNNDGGLNKTNLINLGTFSSTVAAEQISFTSGALVDFLNADTNGIATFIIYQSTQNKSLRAFASREHATLNGPTLNVTAIPEPSSYAALAGSSLLGLALIRRKPRASAAH